MVRLYNFDVSMKCIIYCIYNPITRTFQPFPINCSVFMLIKKTNEQIFIVNVKGFFWVKKKLLWYCNFNIEWKKNGNKMSALLNFNGYFSFLNSQKIDCSKVWFYIVFLYIFFHFRQTFFFLLTFHRTFPSRYKIKFFFFVETVCRFKLCLWHQSKISLENEGNCQILAC